MRKPTIRFTTIVNILLITAMMPVIFASVRQIGKYLGLVPFAVELSGTGSMYPSLFWEKAQGGPDDASEAVLMEYRLAPMMYRYYEGFQIAGKSYGATTIKSGDMIAFQSEATKAILESEGRDPQSGFIKRVIGIPGDKLELRDGYVIKNGEIISEPYIASSRSTYGGTSLPDCRELVVPPDHYFVLGDNRKVSADSRGQLGLVHQGNIMATLPLAKQQLYRSLWRDSSHDQDDAETETLSVATALELINNSREAAGVGKLKLNPKLSKSAGKRGEIILATNDFSVSASASGYTFSQAMSDVGYSNTATGELISHGFYTDKEWFDNLSYFPTTKEQIHNAVYSELGVAAVTREVNSCPTQVIVAHLGGYIPPSYDQEVVASWSKLRENLESVLPSWQDARRLDNIDQTKLEELIGLIEQRLNLAREIEQAMKDKVWLSKDQEARVEQDKAVAEQVSKLTGELNGRD
jgi:signal peptidase I